MSAASLLAWLALFLTVMCANSIAVPDGKEGRDYFYDGAVARIVSCAKFCDLPTDYETTCKEKCKDYIPKERVITTDGTSTDKDEDNTYIYLFIIFGVLIALVLVLVSGFILRKRLRRVINRLDETLCKRLTRAQTETGNGPSEQGYRPVSSQEQPSA